MKNFKRLLASFATLIMLFTITPIATNAEWRQSGNGWWYSQGGSSYATGWTQINGKWYYFDSNGYMKTGWVNDNGNWFYTYGDGTMAHDTTIEGYYLSSTGAWTTSIPTATTSYTSGSSSKSSSSSSGGTTTNEPAKGERTVYWTASGKSYHFDRNCRTLAKSKNVLEGPASSCPKTDPCDVCAK